MLTPITGLPALDHIVVAVAAVIAILAPAITGHRIEAALAAAAPHTFGRLPAGIGPLIGLAAGVAIVVRWFI